MSPLRKHKLKILFASCLLFNTLLSLSLVEQALGQKFQILQVEMKKVEQDLKTQSQATQQITKSVSTQLEDLKKKYQKLNELLNKEISFKEGLKFVLTFEGGYSNDPGDRGGATNLGITHSEYDAYRDRKDLPPRSVAYISLKEAADIYKHTYWLDSGCGDLPRRVAISCFDWQVNSGRGIKTLQDVLGIDTDGIAGHQTFNELDWWLTKPGNEDKLLHNYFEKRSDDYRRWGMGSQAKFLYGWLRRAEALKQYLHVP